MYFYVSEAINTLGEHICHRLHSTEGESRSRSARFGSVAESITWQVLVKYFIQKG